MCINQEKEKFIFKKKQVRLETKEKVLSQL